MCARIEWGVKLSLCIPSRYRVKRGQTLSQIGAAFGTPPRLLAAENGLGEEVCEGQVLLIPRETGNLYLVRGGESKTLLCGSPERFERRNGTRLLYIGQTVLL